MRRMVALFSLVATLFLASAATGIYGAAERPIDVIEDNSFPMEEASNQEVGVVQHIFTAAFNNDSRQRAWSVNFIQE